MDLEPLIEDVRRALTEIPPGQGSVLIAPRHAQALVDEIGRLRAGLAAVCDAAKALSFIAVVPYTTAGNEAQRRLDKALADAAGVRK